MRTLGTGWQHRRMRRLRFHSGPWIRSLVRLDPPVLRRMPAVLLLIAAGLSAWVFELGAVLQGQAQVRNWSSTWVGLDLMEITGLVLTAILLRRRSAYLSAVAAVTATLFALDAWFDVLTASAGSDWYESLAAAFFGEIPMTVALTAVAIWAARNGCGLPASKARKTGRSSLSADDRRPASWEPADAMPPRSGPGRVRQARCRAGLAIRERSGPGP